MTRMIQKGSNFNTNLLFFKHDVMKNLIAIFILCICSGCLDTDKINVPDQIRSKFTSLHPEAGFADWTMEEGNYEASFVENNTKTSILLSPTGDLIQTENEMPADQLPQSVKDYVSYQLGGKKIDEAAIIVDAKGVTTYEVQVNKRDYFFDNEGKF